MILSGVAFGANRPNHPAYLRSGMPDSIAVGIPGAPTRRVSVVTASIRNVPAWFNCSSCPDSDHHRDRAPNQIMGRRAHPSIGDVDDIHRARLLLEHLSYEMVAGA